MFEDEMKKTSSQIWTLFKPYLKDKPLSEEEWDEVVKIAETVKYELPDGYDSKTMRHDPSRWKSALDYYKYGYIFLMMQTLEKYQKGLK